MKIIFLSAAGIILLIGLLYVGALFVQDLARLVTRAALEEIEAYKDEREL